MTDPLLTSVMPPGPTLGDLMEAVSRNETDIDELDFSFLLKRNKRLGAEGCALVARALETNRTVRRLVIREHDIGDHGASAIAAMLCHNATLQHVDLYGNNITDKGAEALAQALYGHAALTQLQLWSNRITDRGAKALAEAVKCNCSLLYLGLVDNSIAQDGAQALLEALDVNFQLETLNLATNAGVPAWLTAQIRAVLVRNRLEAPLMREAWDSAATPGSVDECVKESNAVSRQENSDNGQDDVEEESGHNHTSSISGSGSDASGFLSCSGVTTSAISADGIWI
jgi:Ran GTPase-activating protein (RanGAP) involved in mRNA processing and transport